MLQVEPRKRAILPSTSLNIQFIFHESKFNQESRDGGGGRSPWIEILIARSIEFPLAHARTQLEEERRKPYIRDTVKSVVRVMSRDATKSGLETPFSIDQRN